MVAARQGRDYVAPYVPSTSRHQPPEAATRHLKMVTSSGQLSLWASEPLIVHALPTCPLRAARPYLRSGIVASAQNFSQLHLRKSLATCLPATRREKSRPFMWRFLVTSHFERAKHRYDKKRPDELAAVLRNLARLRELLDGLPHCRTAQAGYLHHEPEGLWAIDQKGPSRTKLQETRLYVFPVDETRTLHIITVGNKNSQAADLRVALEYVRSIEPPYQP